ncbi:hypothetical protein WICMUC_005329 [Wickerhamomyces mucosus]|uniref:Conserved oligomeric Golgi complex subunit 6 n=1 Tax=Wickerhamomyces mucosus TaxID=1378264 RepID=A0A9P8PA21_9ASCO|nr:hypothetical protein WICMUC_005329 [Wickerhamomyces mucosus]
MDFIDYDTFNSEGEFPQPAPPLILPINTVTNKFKNLSILSKLNYSNKSINNNNNIIKDNDKEVENDSVNIVNKTAEKYSKLTVELFESNELSNIDLRTNEKFNNNDNNDGGFSNHINSNTNELSNKLSKILNSYNYDDSSLRDSLIFLQNNPNLIQNTNTNSNSFKNNIESELLKKNNIKLKQFNSIVDTLENFEQNLIDLNKFNEINKINDQTLELVDKIDNLQKEKNLIILKKSLLVNFKKLFIVNEFNESFDTNSITLFENFNSNYKIYQNSEILLSLNNSQIGFKIINKLNLNLLKYYQIFQKNLNNINIFDNNITNNKIFKLSNYFLSNNKELHEQFLKKFIKTRSNSLINEFHLQLNQNLNISIVDSTRYIGDILAYIHSIIVNEIEYIKILFEIDLSEFNNHETNIVENFQKLTKIAPNLDLNPLILSNLNSLNKLIYNKIEIIIINENDLIKFIKIYELFEFYKLIYEKFKLNFEIFKIFDSLQDLIKLRILKKLSIELNNVEKKLIEENWELNDDLLMTTDWLNQYLNDSLLLFETSLDSTQIFKDDGFLNECLELILDKPLEFLELQSNKNFPTINDIKKFNSTNKDELRNSNIFKLNNYDFINYKILPIPILIDYKIPIDQLLTKFISNELNELLNSIELEIPFQLISLIYPIDQIQDDDDYQIYYSLLENKIFNKENIIGINSKIFHKLPDFITNLTDSLIKLNSPIHLNQIINGVSKEFIKIYNVFYKIIKLIYEDEGELLNWNVINVSTLLGLNEDDLKDLK